MDNTPEDKVWWDHFFDNHGTYMESYGEGIGSVTRKTIFNRIQTDESLLDCGCGPGWNYEHGRIHENWMGDYKGTDYSIKFIEACKEKYPDAKWEVQDVRNLTEPDESWDVVLLQDVLEHTNGYEKPIHDALRIARNKVIITFWKHLTDSDEDDIKQSNEGYDGWSAQYSKTKFEAFLNSLGYYWEHETNDENRWHDFYIIYKGISVGYHEEHKRYYVVGSMGAQKGS